MKTFVVATRPDRRVFSAKQMAQQVRGVKIVGDSNPHRIVIESSQETADEIVARFGEELIVEEQILHYPLASKD